MKATLVTILVIISFSLKSQDKPVNKSNLVFHFGRLQVLSDELKALENEKFNNENPILQDSISGLIEEENENLITFFTKLKYEELKNVRDLKISSLNILLSSDHRFGLIQWNEMLGGINSSYITILFELSCLEDLCKVIYLPNRVWLSELGRVERVLNIGNDSNGYYLFSTNRCSLTKNCDKLHLIEVREKSILPCSFWKSEISLDYLEVISFPSKIQEEQILIKLYGEVFYPILVVRNNSFKYYSPFDSKKQLVLRGNY